MKTKECTCKKWHDIVGDEFSKNTNPYSSEGSSVPMYFGRVIDFCPWCGCHLTNAAPDSEGQCNCDRGIKCPKHGADRRSIVKF